MDSVHLALHDGPALHELCTRRVSPQGPYVYFKALKLHNSGDLNRILAHGAGVAIRRTLSCRGLSCTQVKDDDIRDSSR